MHRRRKRVGLNATQVQALARVPHGYHDVEKIREELTEAGFANISIETVDHRSRAASPREPAIAYCQGTPLRNEIEARNALLLEDATEAAAARELRFMDWSRRAPSSTLRTTKSI